MRGFNSETIDLIYLDPPFNTEVDYAAPIGSPADGAGFKDRWSLEDVEEEWIDLIERECAHAWNLVRYVTTKNSDKAYLLYMIIRLLEMKRILKPTGSIWLHCNTKMSHYLKIVMDVLFGRDKFRNEVVWCYRGMNPKAKKFNEKHDCLLYYTKGNTWTFNRQKGEPTPGSLKTYKSAKKRGYNANYKRNLVTVFDREKYELAITNGKIPSGMREKDFDGGKPWLTDWWADIKIPGGSKNKERTGYKTQKNILLLERIVKVSSNEGDWVLDPFCGCATTCVASELLGRKWIGIDVGSRAYDLVKMRILESQGAKYADKGRLKQTSILEKIIHIDVKDEGIPYRTDMEDVPPYNCKENKALLYLNQGQCCAGCNTRFNDQRHLVIDHKIARSKGGTDHYNNLQLLCNNCNSIKGNRGMKYLNKRLASLRTRLEFTYQ